MRRDLPSKFEGMIISSDKVLTPQDVALKGLFVANTSGVTITLPPPQEALDGAECLVVNNTNASVTLACTDGMPNGQDTRLLQSGTSVMLYCAPVSGTSYSWAVVG